MISSTSNKVVKHVITLRDKSKARREEDVFIVEGIKMLREAPADRVKKVFVSESFLKNKENQSLVNKYNCETVSDEVFRHMSDTKTPQGVLAIVKQYHYNIEEILSKNENPFIMILENLQDPGNLGTIMRTAEGAGVSGIIMTKATVDIYNPKTIRSTMGSIFRVPFIYKENISDIVSDMATNNITTYAAHLGGKTNYYEEKYNGPTAFMIGNEANGLTEEASDKADILIKIPMHGQVESLNAAVASTVLMYEVTRQRM